jgi:hypothetical protein
MADTARPTEAGAAGPDEMPAWVRQALAEVSAAVEALNRDQEAAIAEQAFERSAELRERGEGLRQRKAAILRAWSAERGAAPDRRA